MRAALVLVFPEETLRDGQTLRYRLQGHLPSAMLAPTTLELVDFDLAIAVFRKRGESDRVNRLDNLRHQILAALRDEDRRQKTEDGWRMIWNCLQKPGCLSSFSARSPVTKPRGECPSSHTDPPRDPEVSYRPAWSDEAFDLDEFADLPIYPSWNQIFVN